MEALRHRKAGAAPRALGPAGNSCPEEKASWSEGVTGPEGAALGDGRPVHLNHQAGTS
ncbi:hypothetical protein ACFWVP_19040 [Streptomyces sp. NPDC058637]|uniref:hypothetical protein n=1 Tax=Streptomyces sp. NPDC058637 TaxID=3346569 RepID=UPI003655BC09